MPTPHADLRGRGGVGRGEGQTGRMGRARGRVRRGVEGDVHGSRKDRGESSGPKGPSPRSTAGSHRRRRQTWPRLERLSLVSRQRQSLGPRSKRGLAWGRRAGLRPSRPRVKRLLAQLLTAPPQPWAAVGAAVKLREIAAGPICVWLDTRSDLVARPKPLSLESFATKHPGRGKSCLDRIPLVSSDFAPQRGARKEGRQR